MAKINPIAPGKRGRKPGKRKAVLAADLYYIRKRRRQKRAD